LGWDEFAQRGRLGTDYHSSTRGVEFKGDWHERTSASGSYGGREFGGVILLLLQAEGAELNGMWVGAK